jgi:tryptophanase
MMKTIIEPFRAKMVESICFTTRAERKQLLCRAKYNLFQLRAQDVIIDLLTDSGMAAMSSQQWSALMRGDESYAGCSSFYRLGEIVTNTFGFPEVIPVHQGRAGEKILFAALVKPGDVVPSNTHFDTTRANLEACGAEAIDLPTPEAKDSNSSYPFKGNIDLGKLERLITTRGAKAMPFAMLTITNNSAGGQPASLANIQGMSKLLRKHEIPFYIDAARFAENAWLIKQRAPDCSGLSVSEIVKKIFIGANGCLVSAKKDCLANIGGFIAIRDRSLARRLKDALVLTEGFPTYGGLSGRDLEVIAVGIEESINEDYLHYRQASSMYVAEKLMVHGIPFVAPPGLHALYIDAAKFLPHIPALQFPGQALACELYVEAGIRSCEVGSVMFGKYNRETGKETTAQKELVRLALPRRVYSQSHYDYVAEALVNVYRRREKIVGMKIVSQPQQLRHFNAFFEPIADS